MTKTHPGLAAVEAWSRKIHGKDPEEPRHLWCMAAARAQLAGEPMPPAGRGTAFGWVSTAVARNETIARILADPS